MVEIEKFYIIRNHTELVNAIKKIKSGVTEEEKEIILNGVTNYAFDLDEKNDELLDKIEFLNYSLNDLKDDKKLLKETIKILNQVLKER